MSLIPDDTSDALRAWQALAADEAGSLLGLVAESGPPSPALIRQLRRDWPAEVVAAAIELSLARARSRAKFQGRSDLWCDVVGLEQASSHVTAEWKANRFREAGAEGIDDLCCGIGGDSMSLVEVAPVRAVDLDPTRAWMAGRNAGCEGVVADVRTWPVQDRFIHVDPARREGGSGRRSWNPEDYQPCLTDVVGLLVAARGGACKLGPGIPLPLPGRPDGSEIEFLQEGSRLVQAVLWTGELVRHPDRRTATLLPEGLSISGDPGDPPAGEEMPEEGSWLLEPRPALERAGLIPRALESVPGAPREIAPGLGLLHGTERSGSDWFIDWQVAAVLPLREKAIKSWLRDHDAGEVVVRTRGSAVEVDRWSRRLRGTGTRPWIVFGLRLGRTTRAIIVHPAD